MPCTRRYRFWELTLQVRLNQRSASHDLRYQVRMAQRREVAMILSTFVYCNRRSHTGPVIWSITQNWNYTLTTIQAVKVSWELLKTRQLLLSLESYDTSRDKIDRDCRETDDGGLTVVSDCFREFFSHTSFVIFPASSSRAALPAASFFLVCFCLLLLVASLLLLLSLFVVRSLIPIPDL